MQIHNSTYIIITAYLTDRTKTENARRNLDLLHDLLELAGFDYSVVPVSGRYNGNEEESYAFVMPDEALEYIHIQTALLELGDKYGQECLLLVLGKCDPPVAVFLHLKASHKEPSFIEHPWLEIECEDCEGLDSCVGLTRVLDKCFIIDEDSDVTSEDIRLMWDSGL
ncbi:MAG: hypothetical protein GY861_15415 [bacterium]|nr:hypothetical protein [bacterium]